jgi:hypothetical protein
MRRRTLLQSLALVLAWRPVARLTLFAQPPPLTAEHVATLGAVAEVVLPTAVDRAGRERAVTRFVSWVRNYREGADRGHSYGASNLSAPTGPSPAARYPAQFAALDQAARDRGAESFVRLSAGDRRAVIEAALTAPQPVNALPARPNGANLIADFMGMYFNGSEAYDLAYNARIGRDNCSTLEGSDREPARLSGDSRTGVRRDEVSRI